MPKRRQPYIFNTEKMRVAARATGAWARLVALRSWKASPGKLRSPPRNWEPASSPTGLGCFGRAPSGTQGWGGHGLWKPRLGLRPRPAMVLRPRSASLKAETSYGLKREQPWSQGRDHRMVSQLIPRFSQSLSNVWFFQLSSWCWSSPSLPHSKKITVINKKKN